jgi:hypothetical protein
MTFPETSNLWNNVKNNNNIVWKNISVVDIYPNIIGGIRTSVLLAGSEYLRRKFKTADLEFNIPAAEQKRTILDVAQVDIDLNDFTELWLKNGARVKGGELVKDEKGNVLIRAFDKRVRIYGIPVDPKEIDNITAVVTPKEFAAGEEFDFDLNLFEGNGKATIGGERFTVRFRKEREKEKATTAQPATPVQMYLVDGRAAVSSSLKIINKGTELFVSLPDNHSYRLDLIDMNGRLLKSTTMVNQLNLPITDYAKGTYILQVIDRTGKQVRAEKLMF